MDNREKLTRRPKLPVIGEAKTCRSVDETMRQLISNPGYVVSNKDFWSLAVRSISLYHSQELANDYWLEQRRNIETMLKKYKRICVQSLQSMGYGLLPK